MLKFFSGALKAGLYTSQALFTGPSQSLDEMHKAQKTRQHAFSDLLPYLSYTPQQIIARQQYWCSQTYFLAQLIRNYTQQIQDIIKSKASSESDTHLIEVIHKLIIALDDKENLSKFLTILDQDNITIASTQATREVDSSEFNSGVNLYNGDVICLIKELNAKGFVVVTDNAPNSHRDGAAKYSNGSVEELFSRYTDSAWKLVLHFDDVHQRNIETGSYAFSEKASPIDISDYQRRYLKMVLTICAKLLEKKEAYLKSEEFFNDLFKSFPNSKHNKLPIYFDMQNNAYEVAFQSADSSLHWFTDTQKLTTVTGIFDLLKNPSPTYPLTISGYAAPDLRTVESTPFDARSTSNKYLQHPESEGAMGIQLTTGIHAQCQEAIKRAKNAQENGMKHTVAVVFIMPGCGAFKNPEKPTALQFMSAIKYYTKEFEALRIPIYVAEYNKKLFKLLEEANDSFGSEMGQLNELIMNTTSPDIRSKTIKVKEKILELYASGENPEVLIPFIKQTTKLLITLPGAERDELVNEYRKNASVLSKNTHPSLKSLGSAMMILGGAIMLLTGVALSFTGVGVLASAGAFVGGSAMLLSGIGLFSNESKKNIVTLSDDLIVSKGVLL